MRSLQSRGHTGTWVTSGIHDVLAVVMLRLVQQGLDSRLRKRPSSSVQRLLLSPDDGLGVGIAVKILLKKLPREGIELLDTNDGSVGNVVVGAVLVQSSIDLTGTKNDALDLDRRSL